MKRATPGGIGLAFLGAFLLVASPAPARDDLPSSFEKAGNAFTSLVENGAIVGAQLALWRGERLPLTRAYGVSSIGAKDPVTEDTLFLIASCSKPFASTCVLRLAADNKTGLALDDEIDRWLPAYRGAPIKGGGTAARAPTVAELLCHRAGIYSQKVSITPAQSRLIYTFDHTLEDSVNGIAAQPLLAAPGDRYAYSGAGYCVLGRVAELAAGKPFETILQEQICAPLDLTRTTYFPAGKFDDIATGFGAPKAPHRLGAAHLFPLIGGSLYSTASEMMQFGRAAAGLSPATSGKSLIPEKMWSELKTIRNPGKGYTLGWSMLLRNGEIIRLSHSGSLQGYRSYIAVDRSTETCVAATWTLPNPSKEGKTGTTIKNVLITALEK